MGSAQTSLAALFREHGECPGLCAHNAQLQQLCNLKCIPPGYSNVQLCCRHDRSDHQYLNDLQDAEQSRNSSSAVRSGDVASNTSQMPETPAQNSVASDKSIPGIVDMGRNSTSYTAKTTTPPRPFSSVARPISGGDDADNAIVHQLSPQVCHYPS